MTDVEAPKAADRRLQAAQLAADADALDLLMDDRLLFTGPDGRLYSKQDDLDRQRSGQQRLTEGVSRRGWRRACAWPRR